MKSVGWHKQHHFAVFFRPFAETRPVGGITGKHYHPQNDDFP